MAMSFHQFMECNKDETIHNKVLGPRPRCMHLAFGGAGMGNTNLARCVQAIIDNKLNVHCLTLNECNLTDEGVLALVKLLSCHDVPLQRVQCWVLPPGAKTWAKNFDPKANYASLPMLRRVVAASANHPTMKGWDYDYHNVHNANPRRLQYATDQIGHGYPEGKFVTKKIQKKGDRYVERLQTKEMKLKHINHLPI